MKVSILYTLIFGFIISLGSLSHGFAPGHRNAAGAFKNALPAQRGVLVVRNAGQRSRGSELNVLSADPLNPMVEAELCSTMAHVALDFTGLFSPSSSRSFFMRLLAVIGRLFVISADYLPDHTINSDELIIQIFLLSLALRALVIERIAGNTAALNDESPPQAPPPP